MSSSPQLALEEVAKRLGLPDAAVAKVKTGEVVTHELDASSDKDLSLVVAVLLDSHVDKVWDFAQEVERVSEIQDATLSTGFIDPAKPSLDAMDLDEGTVKELLKNPFLSKAEAKRVGDGSKKGMGAQAYKDILLERVQAYWDKGLAGIVPYEGKGRDPKSDIQSANKATLNVIKDPMLREEIQIVPSKSTNESMHKLTWAIQKGNNQAAPVLNHLFRFKDDRGILSVTNRFYSGTDYDSSQILVGVLPAGEDSSILFYVNHTFTSAVAGFGGSAKRSIGRKMMKSTLVETMTKAQKKMTE